MLKTNDPHHPLVLRVNAYKRMCTRGCGPKALLGPPASWGVSQDRQVCITTDSGSDSEGHFIKLLDPTAVLWAVAAPSSWYNKWSPVLLLHCLIAKCSWVTVTMINTFEKNQSVPKKQIMQCIYLTLYNISIFLWLPFSRLEKKGEIWPLLSQNTTCRYSSWWQSHQPGVALIKRWCRSNTRSGGAVLTRRPGAWCAGVYEGALNPWLAFTDSVSGEFIVCVLPQARAPSLNNARLCTAQKKNKKQQHRDISHGISWRTICWPDKGQPSRCCSSEWSTI